MRAASADGNRRFRHLGRIGTCACNLRDKSRGWLQRNFGLVAAEPSFLVLPVAEVVALVESGDLEAKEEEVFAAVMG